MSDLSPDLDLREPLIRSGGEGGLVQIGKYLVNIAHVAPEGKVVIGGIEDAALRASIEDALSEAQARVQWDAHDRARQRYHRAVLDLSGPSYRTLPLPGNSTIDDIFVPLRLASESGEDAPTYGIEDVLVQSRPTLLVGLPGGGKTTLLRRIARHCLEKPEAVGLDRPHLPLLLRLQSVGEASGDDEAIVRTSLQLYGVDWMPPAGFLTAWPAQAGAEWLLLLDGYDEIAVAHRAHVDDWIVAQIRFGRRVVMATRPTSSMPKALADAFGVYALKALEEAAQLELAKHLVGAGAPALTAGLRSMDLTELAGTPLLLTISATVFLAQGGSLPPNRIQLYEAFVAQWKKEEREARRGRTGAPPPDLAEAIAALPSWLALRTSENPDGNWAGGIVADFAAHLVARRGFFPARSRELAHDALDDASRRSGVFVLVNGRCHWEHATFREFLAAQAIAEAPDDLRRVERALRRWPEDRWRQVALMLLGLLSMREEADLTALVRPISDERFPFGVLFVLKAYLEGIPMARSLVERCVDRLSIHLANRGRHNVCARMFSTNQGEYEGAEILRALGVREADRSLLAGHVRRLVTTIRDLAHQEDPSVFHQFAAFYDLAQAGAIDDLIELAEDETLPFQARLAALSDIPAERVSIKGVASLLEGARGFLGEGIETLYKLAASQGAADALAHLAANAISSDSQLLALRTLYDMGESSRLWALVRSEGSESLRAAQGLALALDDAPDEAEVADFVAGVPDELLDASVFQALAARGRSAILVAVARQGALGPEARPGASAAAQALAASGAVDTLLAAAGDPEIGAEAQAALLDAMTGIELSDEGVEAALARLAIMVAADPHHSTLRRLRTQFLFKRESATAQDIVDELEPATRFVGDLAWCLRSRAENLTGLGRPWEAIEALELSLRIEPDHPSGLGCRGLARVAAGDPEGAIEDFVRANELSPYQGWLHEGLLKAYVAADRAEEALAFAEAHAFILEGNVAIAQSALAHLARGDYQTSLSAFDVLKDDPGLTPFQILSRSYALRLLDRPGEALIALGSVSDGPTLFIDVLTADLELCARTGALERGEDVRRRLAEEYPDSDGLPFASALLELATGDPNPLASWCEATLVDFEPGLLFARDHAGPCLAAAYLGRLDIARLCLDAMKTEPRLWLREEILARLIDLEGMMPYAAGCTDVRSLLESLLARRAVPTPRSAQASERPEEKQPYTGQPVYCSKSGIHGFDNERQIALQLVQGYGTRPAIALVSGPPPDWVFGHCNFKMIPEAEYDLKFLDHLPTVFENLPKILQGHGVRRLVFNEAELYERVSAHIDRSRLPIECELDVSSLFPPS